MKKMFLLALLPVIIFAQKKMDFDFDYAQFEFDSASNYVEFYYSFNQKSLTFTKTDSLNYVQGLLHISISDSSTGESLVEKDWLLSNEVVDTADLNKNLIGLLKYVLDEGTYKCEMKGSDIDGDKTRTITEYIKIKPFAKLDLGLSDIQISSQILQDSPNSSSIFYKNTFEVTPTPAAIFGEGQPVLFYYVELYNLNKLTGTSGLRLDQFVVDSRGTVVSSKSKDINRNVGSRVEVGTVMTYKLPTDTYTLMLNLIDSVSNQGVASIKKFFVYNPKVVVEDSTIYQLTPTISSSFGAMSEEELDDLFAKSKYIASKNEIDQYKALSSEQGKREFMQKFWTSRDSNPTGNRNSFYQMYLKRIEECNQKFTAAKKEGWKTDRGRVYMIYGEPNEIERYPNETQARPYEIWHYYDYEGGVYFVFGDLTGFSDYQLLHSTKRGEMRDEQWTRRIAIQ